PDPAHPEHLAAVETGTAVPTPDDLAVARAIETRRSDRRVLSPWPVPIEFIATMIHAAAGEGAVLHVLERESERIAVARLVEVAAVEQALTPDLPQGTTPGAGGTRQ